MDQVFAVFIGLILGLGGPALVWTSVRQYMLQQQFEATGQVTTGTVKRVNVLPKGARLMTYEYTVTTDGLDKTYEGSQSANRRVRQGDAIEIVYLAEKPHVSQPNLSSLSYRIGAIFQVILGIGMVGGFIYLIPFILSEF